MENKPSTVTRGVAKLDEKWDYSGTFYSVHFRVNRPIVIHELGFFGPFKKSSSYDVYIDVREPSYKYDIANCWDSQRIAVKKITKFAEKGKTFYVDLGNLEVSASSNWYLIQFMLDGPETERMDSKGFHAEMEEGDVKFEFLQGSRQMPEICFSLL